MGSTTSDFNGAELQLERSSSAGQVVTSQTQCNVDMWQPTSATRHAYPVTRWMRKWRELRGSPIQGFCEDGCRPFLANAETRYRTSFACLSTPCGRKLKHVCPTVSICCSVLVLLPTSILSVGGPLLLRRRIQQLAEERRAERERVQKELEEKRAADEAERKAKAEAEAKQKAEEEAAKAAEEVCEVLSFRGQAGRVCSQPTWPASRPLGTHTKTHPPTHPPTHPHTHTHTHSLSLSLSLSRPPPPPSSLCWQALHGHLQSAVPTIFGALDIPDLFIT